MDDEGIESGEGGITHDLEEDGANGWNAEDMFLQNEKKYGVQTSYKENLEGYTIQLNKERSSDEYRYHASKI